MNQALINFIAICITGAVAVTVAILNLYQNRKIQAIHVLVNDRLDRALSRIESLETALKKAEE